MTDLVVNTDFMSSPGFFKSLACAALLLWSSLAGPHGIKCQ